MNAEIWKRAETQVELCRVFTNPRRVLILWALADREMSVSEIASTVETSLQNTSQHLHLMRESGVLSSRRDGQKIFYKIADSELLKKCGLASSKP